MEKPFLKCRLCLKLGDFCSIFESDESMKLSDMVMSIANVNITEGDGLSDRVCSACIEILSTSYLFKLQCERIDGLLRKSIVSEIHDDHTNDFNGLLVKDFQVHNSSYYSVEGENEENTALDSFQSAKSYETNSFLSAKSHETSEETDSDVDSIKCSTCNKLGAHTCHVTCTVEREQLQCSSSSETLVASDIGPSAPNPPQKPERLKVSCILCDDKFEDYDNYVLHVNKCTTNVKLHHYVCPVCHEIFTDKLGYLYHLKLNHFKSQPKLPSLPSLDCVDNFIPVKEKTRHPMSVRRQIGWSIEDIYQEIDCKNVEKEPAMPSPIKNFFNKLGNESFSRNSTPKRVSFRKLIEDGKAKTASYFPFKKYLDNYKMKKKDTYAAEYSPIKRTMKVTTQVKASLPEMISDSEYGSPSGTSEESWKLKQNLICACDKKVFMLSESLHDRDRIAAMISELGGVVAENTKMEMLATHYVSVLPDDTFSGMMVCALATGKWLLHVNYVYDSFRGRRFLKEDLFEWKKHPKILEIDNTSVEVAKAAVYWHLELQALNAKFPFEGKQIVLIMKKKYRQYYQMIFKALKAKPVTYDPRTPGSCCSADYCFVDMKIIERVKLDFFARHNVPVFPYQYILIYLLNRGRVDDEHKYMLQDSKKNGFKQTLDFLNNTF